MTRSDVSRPTSPPLRLPSSAHFTGFLQAAVLRPLSQIARASGAHPFLLLFFTLSVLYLLTGSGYITLSDGASMAAFTGSLIHGNLDVPCDMGVPGVAGHCYSKYGPGWSILDIPFYAVGLLLQGRLHLSLAYAPPIFTSSFLNGFFIAATASVVSRFAYSLFRSLRSALVAGLIFGLATPAWAFTKDAFSEPLVMLTLVGAAYLLRHGRSLGLEKAVAAGCILGLAILTRMDALPEAILVLVYGLFPMDRRHPRYYAALLTPVLLFGFLQLAYDQARFGNIFRTGYEYEGGGLAFHRTIGGTLTALGDILVAPSVGVVWFIPTILLAAALYQQFVRTARAAAALGLALFLTAWLEHANVFIPWDAGWTWGPRFMLPILPFLILPLGIVVWDRSNRWRIAAAVLGGLGLVGNLPPIVVNYSRYFYADIGGLHPGAWPQLYLAAAAIDVVQKALANTVPSGRITQLAATGPRAIVQGATSLNAPDFWWYFLLRGHVSTVLTLVALVGLTVSVVCCAMLTVNCLREQSLPQSREGAQAEPQLPSTGD